MSVRRPPDQRTIDEAFADDLDRITREQPPAEPSPWGR